MQPTTALLLALSLTFSSAAFAQSKSKTRKSTPKVEQTPKVKSMNSTESTTPQVAAPLDSDPITPQPNEPLPPIDNPKAAPTNPVADDRENYFGLNVGLGSPHFTNIGLNWVSANKMLSADIGTGAASISADTTKVTLSAFDASLRYHVFAGSFFVGAAIGQQFLSGEATDNIQGQIIRAKVDINTTYLSPQLGWMWGKNNGGFFSQLDIGIQTPLSASSSLTTNADAAVKATPEYQRLDRDIQDQGKKIGETVLPVFMYKLGWLF